MLIRSWMKALHRSLSSGQASRRRSRRHDQRSVCNVDLLEPRTLLTTIAVTSILDNIDATDGETTLREAIVSSNSMPGADLIMFNIRGAGPHTITLNGTALPTVTDQVEIDGSNQAVTIDASLFTSTTESPLVISGATTAGSSLHHLTIANSFNGIMVEDTDHVTLDRLDVPRTGVKKGYGINLFDSSFLTVTNSTVSNRWLGVRIANTTDSLFEDNVMPGTAIADTGASGSNTYRRNDVSGNTVTTAIAMFGVGGSNTFENNNASDSGIGIELRSSVGNVVRNNDFSNSSLFVVGAAMRISVDTEVVIEGNDFSNSKNGIELNGFDNLVITPAGVTSPDLSGPEVWLPIDADLSGVTSTALILKSGSGSTIKGFDLSWAGATRTGTGLRVWNATDTKVQDVTISNRALGISVTGQTGLTVECSELLANTFGLNVDAASQDVTATHNHFAGNVIAVRNPSGDIVNADDNYWGAADGPSNLLGSGDSYSGIVAVSSFLTSLPDCLRDNLPPVLTVGADVVAIEEGSVAINSGTWSDPDTDDTVTLIASVGTVTQDESGDWSWSFDTNDGPDQSQTVTITATDADGATTSSSFELTVNNVAPTLIAVASDHAEPCHSADDGSVTVSGAFSDPGQDTHTVSVNWGDGTIEDLSIDQIADVFSGTHRYATGGIFTVTVAATDSDGATSNVVTTTSVVTGVGVVDGTLYVIGTPGKDIVNIKQVGRRDPQIKVTTNLNVRRSSNGGDRIVAFFDPVDVRRIESHLCDGDDHLNIGKGGSDGGSDGGLDIPALVFGGAGDDHITTGAGNDIVIGGAGNDHLNGRGGNDVLSGGAGKDKVDGGHGLDVLIGGIGKDKLKGDKGDDLLIGGSVANEDGVSLLDTALAAWTNDDLAGALLSLGSISDDGDKDDLSGGKGDDELIGGSRDKLKK